MNEHIPHLNIESLDNGNLRLENESMGETYVVDIHPMHVRLLAERTGLIKAGDANGEQRTLAEQGRELDRLKRNMLRVRAHAVELQDDFRKNADWDHADLTYEMTMINKLIDLLDMAVDDFVDDYTERDPDDRQKRDGARSPMAQSAKPAKDERPAAPNQLELEVTA